MSRIHCCLLADGPSDAALIPILTWVLQEQMPQTAVSCEFADLRRLPTPPQTLEDKIRVAGELYACQLLFIHRDAENQPPDLRYSEIAKAVEDAGRHGVDFPHVCVVPIRMQEAWMLLDEAAIRRASGNPNGNVALTLPKTGQIESIPDPKSMLYELIRCASGLQGRRLKKIRPSKRARLVAEFMGDPSQLRVLSAFRRLEEDVGQVVATEGLGSSRASSP